MKSTSSLVATGVTLCGLLFALSAPLVAQKQSNPQSRQLQHIATIDSLPAKANRWALVIGVDKYSDPQISALKGADNDARTLSDALVRYAGFPQDQVILLATDQPAERQPTRINILRRLSNIASLIPKDGLLLISFAGHGIERGGQAFLIPSDSQITDDISFLEESAISVSRIKERIRSIGLAQVLILLDACRNDPGGRADAPNPLTAAYVKAFNFDVRNHEVNAFATLYATAVGQRAYEYTEKRQGYFTWAIVEALKGGAANDKGEVTLASLVQYVQDKVPRRVEIDLGTGKQQRPFAQIEGYKADELVIAVADKSTEARPAPFSSTPTSNAVEQYVKAGDQFAKDNKFDDAATQYRVAVGLDPSDPVLHNKLGFALYQEQKYVESEAEYRTALKLESNNAEAHYGVGRALRAQNRLPEAESEAREAVRLQPDSAKFHATLGNTLGLEQKWVESEAELATALRLEPNNSEWHLTLARILRFEKKYPEAEASAREAVRLDKNNAWNLGELGRILWLLQKFPESEENLRAATRLEPMTAGNHGALGYALWSQKKYPEAETEFQEAVRLEPANADYRDNLGNILIELHKFAEAEGQFRESLRLQPNIARFHNNLGSALENQKRYAEAEVEYREAARLDPSTSLYQTNLERILKSAAPAPTTNTMRQPPPNVGLSPKTYVIGYTNFETEGLPLIKGKGHPGKLVLSSNSFALYKDSGEQLSDGNWGCSNFRNGRIEKNWIVGIQSSYDFKGKQMPLHLFVRFESDAEANEALQSIRKVCGFAQ